MVPGWVRGEIAKLLNGMNGEHDGVMVAAVALLGPDGFDVQSCEQTNNFDPNEYGPVMLQGYTMLAAAALAKTLGTVHASTDHEHHFTNDIEDPEERLQALRNLYESAIRQFLDSMFTYAGAEFQQKHESDLSTAAGSQLVALWQRIATGTIQFRSPQGQSTGEQNDDGNTERRTEHDGSDDGKAH